MKGVQRASEAVMIRNVDRLLDEFEILLASASEEWQLFLHPSQEMIVGLPVGFRAVVAGSAGTGKTVAAWHRCQRLLASGHQVGFVCPDDAVLDVSKAALACMPVGDGSPATSWCLVQQTS